MTDARECIDCQQIRAAELVLHRGLQLRGLQSGLGDSDLRNVARFTRIAARTLRSRDERDSCIKRRNAAATGATTESEVAVEPSRRMDEGSSVVIASSTRPDRTEATCAIHESAESLATAAISATTPRYACTSKSRDSTGGCLYIGFVALDQPR